VKQAWKYVFGALLVLGAQPVKVVIDGEEQDMTLALLLAKESRELAGAIAVSVVNLLSSKTTKTVITDQTNLVKRSPKVVIFG